MKIYHTLLACLLLNIYLVVQAEAEDLTIDPYDIIAEHYEAVGGLDRIKGIKTVYTEGKYNIVGSELAGEYKSWEEKPLRSRLEVDLNVVKIITGDNGEFRWRIDPNGKILVQKDEATIKERTVDSLMETFSHLDLDSPYFTIKYRGVENINNEECYIVEITNSVNKDIVKNYYSMKNYYLMKKVVTKPDREEHTEYSDFRRVEGQIKPFLEVNTTLPTGEILKLEHTSYTFNEIFDKDLFEPPQADVKDFIFANGESAEDIPFDFIENNIYLPVNIGGKEKLWVLDCGASVTVMDSAYASELGLIFEGPIKARAAVGVVDLYFATIPSYSLDGIVFEKQTVMTMNLRDLFQKVLGLEIAGILGYDFLSRFVTKIDYANEKLSFYSPDRFEYSGDGKIVDSPLDEERMFSIPVTVDKKYSGNWQLDIGASGNAFHYPFAVDNGLIERKGTTALFFGASGPGQTVRSRFETMELDGLKVRDILIDVPKETGSGAFSARSLAGNIGNSFLKHFVLYLDYDKQQIILEKGDDYDTKFAEPKSGLGVWYADDKSVEVFFVAPDTPADKAGIKKDDIIISVNGIKIEYLDGLIALRKLFKEEAGTTYVFGIKRDGEYMEKTVTLQNMY